MNQLQHIRSMAEMILKQVDELEGKPAVAQNCCVTDRPIGRYRPPPMPPAKPEPKFKVGDRVNVSRSRVCNDYDYTGTVADIRPGPAGYSVLIRPDGVEQTYYWWDENVLTLVKEAKPKFKLGDRVKVRNTYYYKGGEKLGDIVFVGAPTSTGQTYGVEFSNGTDICFHEADLSKADELEHKPAVEPKFKVGDKVVWRSDTEEKVLTIVGVGHDQFNMDAHAAGRVTFPNETGVYFQYDVTSERGDICTFGEAALEMYDQPNSDGIIWHSGPPPHVGWWNASRGKADYAWRWWNGEYWSISVSTTDDAELAAQCALHGEPIHHEQIQWTDYWPENARVPRIVPDVHLAKNNYKAYYHWHDTNTFEIWHLDPITGDVTKV